MEYINLWSLKTKIMKILYLTARQPYPYTKGDQFISYNQIKELSKKHEIYLVSFYEDNYVILYEEMKKYCKELILFKITPLKKITSALKVLINPTSIQANMYYSDAVKKKIDELCSKVQPDVVHVLTFRMAQYFLSKDIEKTIDLVDAYSLNMKKRRDNSKSILWLLWHLECKLLRRYEKKIIRDFKKKTITAKRDREYFQDNNIIVNPTGINKFDEELAEQDTNKDYKNIKELKLIFQGNMSYYANVQAVRFLANKILPDLDKKEIPYKLYLIGGNPSKEVIRLTSNKITVTGYVKDINKYLREADIALYPIFTATGMQTKILEALACKIPCIATQQCVEGIEGLEDGINILIANSNNEFIEKISYIYNNKGYVEKIISNGYNLVEKKYLWERNIELLEKLWDKKL